MAQKKSWSWLWWLLGLGATGGVVAFAFSRRASAQVPSGGALPLITGVHWSSLATALASAGIDAGDMFGANLVGTDVVAITFTSPTSFTYHSVHGDGTIYTTGSVTDAASNVAKVRTAYTSTYAARSIQLQMRPA